MKLRDNYKLESLKRLLKNTKKVMFVWIGMYFVVIDHKYMLYKEKKY